MMPIYMILYCLLLLCESQTVASVETVSSACDHTNPCPLRGGAALPRCSELHSNDGFLDVVLEVEIGYFQFEWLNLTRRSYNGTKCPPTLWIKPGDTLNVTLVNNLKSGNHTPDGNPVVNITNLHTHGLHISSLEPQDNVFIEVQPGESYQYSYKILDYHSPGTNWYHSHHHLSTTVQTVGGMAGMLIIEDDPNEMPAELRAVSCPENCQHDIPLIMSPMLSMPVYITFQKVFGDSLRLPNDLENWLSGNLDTFAVNGEFMPVITLEKNQLTRFRILNVGQMAPLELYIVDGDGNVAPCDFREIARDGVYFDEPRTPKYGQSVLHPANRLDWLIKCSEQGEFKLYSHAQSQHTKSFGGGARKSSVIATIQVTEHSGDNSTVLDFPASLPARPQYLADLRNATPDQYITVEIGGNNELNRDVWKGPTNYRFKVEVDSIVEIQLISADYRFGHPIHFHVNHMQVMAIQPYTGPVAHYEFINPIWEFRDQDGDVCYYQHPKYVEGAVLQRFNISDSVATAYLGHYQRWINGTNDSLAYSLEGEWIDTAFSPALSNITYRMKTDNFTGPLLIHCHIPSDSDFFGMMMVIEVVEKGANLSGANILSGRAAPGSCKKCDWNRFMETPLECSAGAVTTFGKSMLLIMMVMAVLILATL